MAGRSRKRLAKTSAPEKTIQSALVEGIAKLYARHADEIRAVREESEQQIVNVSFGVKINCSEVSPTVRTRIQFSSRVTDSVTARLDDPNQGKFEFDDDTAPGKDEPRRRGRPEKGEVTVSAGDSGSDGTTAQE